jgi:hypothetical protein
VEQLVSDIIDEYIDKEQLNTKFDLTKRVLTIELNDPQGENDIVVEIDVRRLTNQDFTYIQQLAEIIADSAEPGTFELGNLLINIYSTETYEKNLVSL